MNSFSNVMSSMLAMFGFLLILGLVLAVPVMFLWNTCLVPAIPYFKEIGILQAFGLNILFKLLFSSNVSVNKS